MDYIFVFIVNIFGIVLLREKEDISFNPNQRRERNFQ